VRRRWVTRELDVPATVAWDLLTDTAAWPTWGPSVRSADIEGGRLVPGATGSVTTVVGVRVPFTITEVDPGRSWSWEVAGIPATGHRVEPLGPDRCAVGFSVPWPALAYLLVCRMALRNLALMSAGDG